MRRLLWGALIVAFGAGLFLLYRYFVLAGPDKFEWSRNGTTYTLLDPRVLGVLLVSPLLLFVLWRSLADLPWPQRVLSLVVALGFLVLRALRRAGLESRAVTGNTC